MGRNSRSKIRTRRIRQQKHKARLARKKAAPKTS